MNQTGNEKPIDFEFLHPSPFPHSSSLYMGESRVYLGLSLSLGIFFSLLGTIDLG